MDTLTDISETALLTLKSRVVQSKKEAPLINGPIWFGMKERRAAQVPKEIWVQVLEVKFSPTVTSYITQRVCYYDHHA